MTCTCKDSAYYTIDSGDKVCAACFITSKLNGATPNKELIAKATSYYARSHMTKVASVRSNKELIKDALVEYIKDGHI